MSDQRDLESLLASRFPLVAIETNEEVRARELVGRIARGKNWRCFPGRWPTGWRAGISSAH
jgi:hypothetical protein